MHCCCKLFSKHYTEKLVMQISVTDLFIEGEQQSNKHNNAYEKQNLWRWHSVTNWNWWQDRNREMFSFVIQKQPLLYIIHFMHILLLQSTLYHSLNYHSEYAKAFNNLTCQCLFSTSRCDDEFVWILSQFWCGAFSSCGKYVIWKWKNT